MGLWPRLSVDERAWPLMQETAEEFGAPLITASPGGASGGGAQPTKLGTDILRLYRATGTKAAEAAATDLARLEALAHHESKQPQRRTA